MSDGDLGSASISEAPAEHDCEDWVYVITREVGADTEILLVCGRKDAAEKFVIDAIQTVVEVFATSQQYEELERIIQENGTEGAIVYVDNVLGLGAFRIVETGFDHS